MAFARTELRIVGTLKFCILLSTLFFSACSVGCGPAKQEGPRLADPAQADPRLTPVGAGSGQPVPAKNQGVELKGKIGQ
jgi:hypothetical protein